MTFRRSYEDAEASQQLYAVLEAVKKPEALWAKLASGNYDWLGVRRNGRYVVGRPRLTAVGRDDDAPLPDPERDRHRIESLGPLSRAPRWEAYRTADEARDAYSRIVTGDPVTPMRSTGVWKVRLILDGKPVEELLVVRALPRMV
jgi:hypothetical protein